MLSGSRRGLRAFAVLLVGASACGDSDTASGGAGATGGSPTGSGGNNSQVSTGTSNFGGAGGEVEVGGAGGVGGDGSSATTTTSTTSTGGSNACTPNPCMSAPLDECDGSTLITYPNPGVCTVVGESFSCAYPAMSIDCRQQNRTCSSGMCVDPCSVVTCDVPPPSACNGNVLLTYNPPGTCSATSGVAMCDYASTPIDCAMTGQSCFGGACLFQRVDSTVFRTYSSSNSSNGTVPAASCTLANASCHAVDGNSSDLGHAWSSSAMSSPYLQVDSGNANWGKHVDHFTIVYEATACAGNLLLDFQAGGSTVWMPVPGTFPCVAGVKTTLEIPLDLDAWALSVLNPVTSKLTIYEVQFWTTN